MSAESTLGFPGSKIYRVSHTAVEEEKRDIRRDRIAGRKSTGHSVPELRSILTMYLCISNVLPRSSNANTATQSTNLGHFSGPQRTSTRTSTAQTAINNASQFAHAQTHQCSREHLLVSTPPTTSAILPPDSARFNTTTTTRKTSYADPAITQFIVPTESKALQQSQQQAVFIAHTFRKQLRYPPHPPAAVPELRQCDRGDPAAENPTSLVRADSAELDAVVEDARIVY
ncbi:hypothetical protein BJ742DRAFT_870379 [Cladochytrium replicatum]|nr:hypothetical protein BJ742DRAFT_870379 [Cladochytrium replicatum]